MPNGMPSNGGSGGGGYSPPPKGTTADQRNIIHRKKPMQEVTKSISYTAGSGDSPLITSFSQSDSTTALKTAIPSAVVIENTGKIPAIAITAYEGYSDENTDEGTHTIQTMLMPHEKFEPPVRGIIPTANQLRVLDGTVVDFTTTIGDGSSTLAT